MADLTRIATVRLFRSSVRLPFSLGVVAAGLLCCLTLLPSASGAVSAIKASRLLVQPVRIELNGASGEHGLLVTAVASDGRNVDVTAQAKFTSKDPQMITVTTNGNGNGSAETGKYWGYPGTTVSVTMNGPDGSFPGSTSW